MKIIQIVGRSNTGKTHFIKDLIAGLNGLGRVGAVKHLGHHVFALEESKDTTLYHTWQAAIAAGVDDEKTVFIAEGNQLDETLRMLCDAGIKYAILEGFKTRPFPRIVIGDLESECVLRNPTVEDVIASLDRFQDYHTVEGLVKELKRECDASRAGAILTFNGLVREYTGEQTDYLDFENDIDAKLAAVREEIEALDGIIGVRFHHRKGRLFAGEDITYLVVMAEHGEEAFSAASAAIERLKQYTNTPENRGV